MTSKVIQGHIRPLLCQNHSSTFVYGHFDENLYELKYHEDTIYDL